MERAVVYIYDKEELGHLNSYLENILDLFEEKDMDQGPKLEDLESFSGFEEDARYCEANNTRLYVEESESWIKLYDIDEEIEEEFKGLRSAVEEIKILEG